MLLNGVGESQTVISVTCGRAGDNSHRAAHKGRHRSIRPYKRASNLCRASLIRTAEAAVATCLRWRVGKRTKEGVW